MYSFLFRIRVELARDRRDRDRDGGDRRGGGRDGGRGGGRYDDRGGKYFFAISILPCIKKQITFYLPTVII